MATTVTITVDIVLDRSLRGADGGTDDDYEDYEGFDAGDWNNVPPTLTPNP